MEFFEIMIAETLPLALTFVCGMIFTVKTNFFQFRYLLKSVKTFFKQNSTNGKKGVSTFGAVCTSLASTIGTGNIVGVATAVSIGGPGAVFWMVISAFFSMIIKVFEIILCVHFRSSNTQGPFCYISKAFMKFKIMIPLFAVSTLFSSFAGGNITQVNTIAHSFSSDVNTRIIIGIFVAVLVFVMLSGGAKRVFKFSEMAVPVMSVIYLLLCFFLMVINRNNLPDAFASIFKGAFTPKAATGGAVGSIFVTCGIGVSRGIFSNEAGIGTSAFAHSSTGENSVKEGLCGIFEVFFDTTVMCTITGVVICSSGVFIDYGTISSSQLIIDVFERAYGSLSNIIISAMLSIFGITSTVGWGYFGINAVEQFFKKGKRIYIFIYSAFCVVGAVCSIGYAWRLAAFFNGVMMCINMPALIRLSGTAVRDIKIYENTLKKGKANGKIIIGD